MIGPLNHVGIAVPSIEDAVDTYKNLYGVSDISEPGEMIEQGVRYCFVNLPNSQIELIEPLGDNSPINNFLEKNPKGGHHHVCFEVDDIYKAKQYDRCSWYVNYFCSSKKLWWRIGWAYGNTKIKFYKLSDMVVSLD